MSMQVGFDNWREALWLNRGRALCVTPGVTARFSVKKLYLSSCCKKSVELHWG